MGRGGRRYSSVYTTIPYSADAAAALPFEETPSRVGEYAWRIWIGFGLAIVTLLLTGVAGWRSIAALVAGDSWVDHTNAVIEDTLEAIDLTRAAQSDLRAWALTANDRYVLAALGHLATLDGKLKRIGALVADNPAQGARLRQIAALAAGRRAALDALLALRDRAGFAAAQAALRSGIDPRGGGAAMIAGFGTIAATERGLLVARGAAVRGDAIRSLRVIAVGGLAAIFCVGFAALFIDRSLRALARHGAMLAASRRTLDRLKSDLEERTALAENRARALAASEDAIRRHSALMRAVIDRMSDALIVRGRNGEVLLANAALMRLAPLPPGESRPPTGAALVEYYEVFDGVSGAPLAPERLPLARALGGEEFDDCEVLMRRRTDGMEIRTLCAGRPLVDAGGEVFAGLVVARDITARRRAEFEQARLAAIVQSSDDAVISLTPDGIVQTWNPGAERLFGYAAAERLGRAHGDAVEPPEERGAIAAVLARLAADRETQRYVARRRRKDGRMIEIAAVFSPILDGRGRLTAASAILRDITAERRIVRELAERTRELERSNAELQQFAYSASHDLQEPLRMIASYVQLIRDRYRGRLDADADDFIDYAVEGATRMKRLIDDLLRFSRAGRGRPPEPSESAAALDWALANLAMRIQESGARITHGPMPPVVADASQLGQVFQNLIDNAIKFRGAEPPEIDIAAVRRGEFWEFRVRDNGIGIDPRHAARIFQMFQRLYSRAEYPGTGIGLAICRKIVERHGGEIEVESRPGQGALFRFTIPAADPDVGAGAAAMAEFQ